MKESAGGPILLVGAGRMGGALLRGWLAQGIVADRIFVREPSPSPEIAALIQEHRIGAAADLPSPPAVLLLAVKPQSMDEVAPALAPLAGPQTVVLSVAAGTTIAGLSQHFTPHCAIIRAMPNTPAAIGRGITALFANPFATEAQKRDCETLLRAAGEVVWLEAEAQMDAVTALSGSGPAYIFLLAECMAKAGEAAGLPAELAAKLARATVAGAGEMLHRSDLGPDELRRNVTSPNGTTAAALAVLMGEGAGMGAMEALLRDAIAAAARRSRELAN